MRSAFPRGQILNKEFGRLTTLEIVKENHDWRGNIIRCKCSCGNYKNVYRKYLVRGSTKSCGCLKRESIKRFVNKEYLNGNGNS